MATLTVLDGTVCMDLVTQQHAHIDLYCRLKWSEIYGIASGPKGHHDRGRRSRYASAVLWAGAIWVELPPVQKVITIEGVAHDRLRAFSRSERFALTCRQPKRSSR